MSLLKTLVTSESLPLPPLSIDSGGGGVPLLPPFRGHPRRLPAARVVPPLPAGPVLEPLLVLCTAPPHRQPPGRAVRPLHDAAAGVGDGPRVTLRLAVRWHRACQCTGACHVQAAAGSHGGGGAPPAPCWVLSSG